MCSKEFNQSPDNDDMDTEFQEELKKGKTEFPTEPLERTILISNWCKNVFEFPLDAIESLKNGIHLKEAATALFGFTFAEVYYSRFDMGLEEMIIDCDEIPTSPTSYRTGISLDYIDYQNRRKHILEDLLFIKDYNKQKQLLDALVEDNPDVIQYVKLMLTTSYLLLNTGVIKNEYNVGFDEKITKLYKYIKSGEVREAQLYNPNGLKDDGRNIEGDVKGYLACVACTVICETYAQITSSLRKDFERDFEGALDAYIFEAQFIDKMGYQIDFLDDYVIGEDKFYFHDFEGNPGKYKLFWNAIYSWEQLRINPNRVLQWAEIKYNLLKLENLMWGYSFDRDLLYPGEAPGFVYLPEQIAFCDGFVTTN